MARQKIHDRRAGGRGSAGAGSSFISYSDMMAALVLVFVLILCVSLYRYFTMLESKTAELDRQSAALVQQQAELDAANSALAIQQDELAEKTTALAVQQAALTAANSALSTAQSQLTLQQSQLASLQTQLAAQQSVLDSREAQLETLQTQLAAQQSELDSQTTKLVGLVGIRSEIITALSEALAEAQLSARVDPETGEIVLNSAVFFETNKSEIKEEGRELLDAFVPVYLSVLLRPEYAEYLGSIVIEGHTDTLGSYLTNLKLSTSRALAVADYVFGMDALTNDQIKLLQSIMTATGRSWSDPVYRSDGSVDMDASRRVEFKFTLKDSEMIDEMNRLLTDGH